MTTFSTFVNKKKLSFFKNDHFFDIHFFRSSKHRERGEKKNKKVTNLFKHIQRRRKIVNKSNELRRAIYIRILNLQRFCFFGGVACIGHH